MDKHPGLGNTAIPGQLALGGMFERLFGSLEPQHVIETLVQIACQESHAEHAAIVFQLDDGLIDIAGRARAFGSIGAPPSQRLLTAVAEIGTYTALYVQHDGETHAELRRMMRDENLRTLLAVPMAPMSTGAVVLGWRDTSCSDQNQLQLATMIARNGGIALHHARQHEAVTEQCAFLAALVEQTSDALVVADWQTLRVVTMNHAAELLFAETRAELQSVQLEQILVPEIGDWLAMRQLSANDEQIALLKRGDGNMRPVGLIPSEVRTTTARFMLLTVRDLSDRWQAIQRLVQTEKLGGMRRLTSSIAHHINNPMQAIATSLRLLQQPLDNARRERYLQLAHEEIERLIGLVRRTLAVYQPVQESMRTVSIHVVLQSAVEQVAPQLAEQNITLDYDLGAITPKVLGFASHLREVFQNLATNALEAMPDGGCLLVRTFTVQSAEGNSEIVIEFSDTGAGITPERLETIFEPYNSIHPDRAGLGLAISYSIVENHAGQLSVSSGEDGTTFRVTLPLLDEAPASSVSAAVRSTLDSAQ